MTIIKCKTFIKGLVEKVEKTYEQMEIDRSDHAIVEFLVSGQHGVYSLEVLGEMLEIDELKNKDPYSEGYHDYWNDTLSPKINDELNKAITERFNGNVYIYIDYEEHSGNLALLATVDPTHWDGLEYLLPY